MIKMYTSVAGVFLLSTATTATAQNMPLQTFFLKAEALEKRGALALLSSDYKLLRREMQTSAAQLRNERLAAAKARTKPAYCPPTSTPLTSEEIVTHFRAIPVAARLKMSTRDGFRSLLAKKYPCPA